MTDQEAFDKVWDHFITKGRKRSVVMCGGDEVCAYRGKSGAKCAVGVLIPDEEYLPEFNTYGVREIAHKIPSLDNANVELLADMQGAHDGWVKDAHGPFKQSFKEDMIQIAIQYELTVPTV